MKMKRRQAIVSILVLGGGAMGGLAGYKAYRLFKEPDFAWFEANKGALNAMAECIIPTTNTPGAAAANVGDYIAKAIYTLYDKKTQNTFIDGMKHLQDICISDYGNGFENCTPDQQREAMAHMQKKGKPYSGVVGKVEKKLLGTSFFTTLKELTIYGYCTSKAGAGKGLAYDYVPGSFKGCIPLQPGQRSWATK